MQEDYRLIPIYCNDYFLFFPKGGFRGFIVLFSGVVFLLPGLSGCGIKIEAERGEVFSYKEELRWQMKSPKERLSRLF